MKKLFSALTITFALLLASCNEEEGGTNQDKYTFTEKQYTMNPVEVSFVEYQTRKDFEAAGREIGKIPSDRIKRVQAFTTMRTGSLNKCTIHMMDPTVKYQPEFVGHEAMHCFFGQWHINNESN